MDDESFKELLESIREGMAINRGEQEPSRSFHFSSCDVHSIRNKFGFSQREFAMLLGISVRTLQNWENGHRKPTGTAKVLLEIIDKYPDVFLNKRNNCK